MKRVLQLIWVAMFAVLAASAQAQTTDPKVVAPELKKGGYVIVMRHGATNRDQADTDPLNPDNVAKQRLLSEQGRNKRSRSVNHSRSSAFRSGRSTPASSIVPSRRGN